MSRATAILEEIRDLYDPMHPQTFYLVSPFIIANISSYIGLPFHQNSVAEIGELLDALGLRGYREALILIETDVGSHKTSPHAYLYFRDEARANHAAEALGRAMYQYLEDHPEARTMLRRKVYLSERQRGSACSSVKVQQRCLQSDVYSSLRST